jgi:hypothetical protein
VNTTLLRSFVAASTALPALAAAQAAVADQESEPSRLWWMWIALVLVLLATLIALFVRRDPRARAGGRTG